MPTAPRVLVVQHEPDTDLGLFDGWLAQAGLVLDVRHPYAGDALPPFRSYDAVVVLGGAMGPLDEARSPWLPAVRAGMAEAVDASVPQLGICLGAELLAVACGGAVRHGSNGPELGVLDIDLHPVASTDEVFRVLPPTAPVVQWHWEEIVDVPPGATVLAGSKAYAHQVFRVGERAWGVQGHPEVTAGIAQSWAREDSPLLLAAGRTPEQLVADVREHEAALTTTWRPVAEAFARVVTRQFALRAAH